MSKEGQLGVLAATIILGFVGFVAHGPWILVIILLAVLWGHMTSTFRGARSTRDGTSNVVGAVGDERRDLTDTVSSVLTDVGLHDKLARQVCSTTAKAKKIAPQR